MNYSQLTKTEAGLLCRDAGKACENAMLDQDDSLPTLLKWIFRTKAWRYQTLDGRICKPQLDGLTFRFDSFSEMVSSLPCTGGWGLIPRDLRSLIEHDQETLALFDDAMNQEVESTSCDRSNGCGNWAVCLYAGCLAKQIIDGLDNFPVLLERVIVAKAWRRFQHPQHGRVLQYESLRDLVITWGRQPSDIKEVLRGNPRVLSLFLEEMADIYFTGRGDDD